MLDRTIIRIYNPETPVTTLRTRFASGARDTRRWLCLTLSERALFLEAVLLLAVARLVARGMRSHGLTRFFGTSMAESANTDTADAASLRQLAWALAAASRRLPWRCKCLEQSLAGKLMLRRRGLSNTLYLGVARADNFQAHAWLRTGSFILAGAQGMERFRVLATFADDPT